MENKITRWNVYYNTKQALPEHDGIFVHHKDHQAALSELQKENASLKNTIGHWQIKNDALQWDKAQAKITALLELIKQADEGLSFYGEIRRWSESTEGVNDRINFDGDENFEDEYSAEQMTISGKKARQVRANIADKLKELGL